MSKTKEIPVPDEIKGFTQVRLDVDLTDAKIGKLNYPMNSVATGLVVMDLLLKYFGMNVLLELTP